MRHPWEFDPRPVCSRRSCVGTANRDDPLRNKPRRRVATLERIDGFLKLPSGVSSRIAWLQSSMVAFCLEDDRAVSHSAKSTPVGDRFKPSQNLSRTRDFALVSNAGILRR